ncbi:MAG: CARDB domain-containing protein [Solirubrobacteraceae bacterium]
MTLTLGQDATPGQIDDVEPNEEFEEGLVGEPLPPVDTPYKPTESQTTSGAPSPEQRAASDHFTLLRSTPTNPLGGSVVQEPTAVNDGNVILATGNTWARLSTDDGLTWPNSLVLNPASNPPPGDKVCCDQVAYAVDRGDHTLSFWLLQNDCGGVRCGQSNPNPTKQNALTLRMFANQSELLGPGQPCDLTLSPSMFGIKNSFFDFNKVSSTGKFLYVVTDVRTLTHTSGGAEIIRLSLNHLDDGDCRFSWRAWDVKKETSLAPVEHAGSTMFFAGHTSDTTNGDELRIYSLADSSTNLKNVVRDVHNYAAVSRNLGKCPSPDGDDPCQRFGDNQTVGFHAGNSVGWLWTATQDKRFPFPQVRVAVFRTSSLNLVEEHTIWNKKFAWTYPAVGVNERHELGIVLYEMGGGRFPSADAFLRPDPRDWSGIKMHRIATGSASFTKNVWGDYASVHAYAGCPNSFLGTAFTVQSNAGTTVSENRSAWFGKDGDGCADLAVTAVSALPALILVGDTLSIVHTTKNLGSASASATTTRYFLSRDAVVGEGDVPLGATSAEPTLVAGGESNPAATLSAVIPAVAPGTYHLIACANDSHPVPDTSATNNCFSPPQTFTIGVTAG